MKHLKTYKIFESYNDDESFLNDTFLELEDIGYEINIDKLEDYIGRQISFEIEIKRQYIDENILQAIKMSVSYMLNKKYKYFIRLNFFGVLKDVKELESYFNQTRTLINKPKRSKITIRFYKTS